MALFTDGTASTLEDLTSQDPQVLDVASAEGIDLVAKLAVAHSELALELSSLLRQRGPALDPLWSKAASDLSHVVVTAPLRMWHAYRALELAYQDAYFNQMNERYKAKRDSFHEMALWARERLIDLGIGVVTDPSPQAVAPATAPDAGNLPAGTYFVSVAWVNRRGEEGACSTPAAVEVQSGSLRIEARNAPENCAGWNVYLGSAPDSMVLQNNLPIPIGERWTQPSSPISTGRSAGTGQSPNYLFAAVRKLQRG